MDHVIFDLSEVLIYGLSGFQGALTQKLGIRPETTFEMFGGIHLQELLRGKILEDQYILALIEKNAWDPSDVNEIKKLVRENFHNCVPGTIEIVLELAKRYEMTLLSDHAKEWVEYIDRVHPFIDQVFTHVYFSYRYGKTKREAAFFEIVMQDLHTSPERCLFIDDSIKNIAVATGLGFNVILFKNAVQLRQELVEFGLLENRR